MSKSKNTVNGAGWMRRSLVAIAGAAMAFTALSAAPSQDAPVEDEVAWSISSKSSYTEKSSTWGRTDGLRSYRGGSWG